MAFMPCVAVVNMRIFVPFMYLLTPHSENGTEVIDTPNATRDVVSPVT